MELAFCKRHDFFYSVGELCTECYLEDKFKRCIICSDILPPNKVCDSCGECNTNL